MTLLKYSSQYQRFVIEIFRFIPIVYVESSQFIAMRQSCLNESISRIIILAILFIA